MSRSRACRFGASTNRGPMLLPTGSPWLYCRGGGLLHPYIHSDGRKERTTAIRRLPSIDCKYGVLRVYRGQARRAACAVVPAALISQEMHHSMGLAALHFRVYTLQCLNCEAFTWANSIQLGRRQDARNLLGLLPAQYSVLRTQHGIHTVHTQYTRAIFSRPASTPSTLGTGN